MAKSHRNLTPLLLLPADLLGWLFELLGLHGLNLRATCRHLSQHPLSEGVALAHKVIKVGPSIPLRMHVPRRTTRGVAHSRWDYFGYRASLVWRTEWALALKDIDAAPIRALLDAHAAFPPDDKYLVRDGWIGATEVQRWYMSVGERAREESEVPARGRGSPFRVRPTLHTAHARLALFKAVEARLWDVIRGVDLERPMSEQETVAVVKRILTRTPVDNDQCFFFTFQGWLRYTPLLLAAERHNLPLVKYLARRADTDLRATSRGGNNAYAICKNAMWRNGKSEHEIAASPVLHYLRSECWCYEQPYRCEGR